MSDEDDQRRLEIQQRQHHVAVVENLGRVARSPNITLRELGTAYHGVAEATLGAVERIERKLEPLPILELLAFRTAEKVGVTTDEHEVTRERVRTLRADVDLWMRKEQIDGTIAAQKAAEKRESVRPAMKAKLVDGCDDTGLRKAMKETAAGDALAERATDLVFELAAANAGAARVTAAKDGDVKRQIVWRVARVVLGILALAGAAAVGRYLAVSPPALPPPVAHP